MKSVQKSDLRSRHLSKVAALDLSTTSDRITLTRMPIAGEQVARCHPRAVLPAGITAMCQLEYPDADFHNANRRATRCIEI